MVPGGVARHPKPELIGTPLNGWRSPKADGGPGGAGTYGAGLAAAWPRGLAAAAAAAAAASAMRRCSASQASRSLRSRSTISAATASCRALTWASWRLDSRLGGLELPLEPGGVGDQLVHLGLLGFRLVTGGLFACQRGVGLRLEVLDLGFHRFEPGLRVDVGGVLLGEFVHRGVLAAHRLVGEVDGVREAAALVGAEEQREVGGHAAGLVGLGGDLSDQLPGVGNLLLVRLELLGDLGLVLLSQIHASGEGLGFLDRGGDAALGVQQGLLRTGKPALVNDEVRGGLGDPGVHELQGMLDLGGFVAEGGLLVLEGVGERDRG